VPHRETASASSDAATVPWSVGIAVGLVAVAGVLWAWRTVPRPQPRFDLPIADLHDEPLGTYGRVQAVVGPLSVRLDDGKVVRLAGLAEPTEATEAAHLTSALEAILPPGTKVYVVLEPGSPSETQGSLASLYLPPTAKPQADSFPFADSRLVGADLVQQGVARADPSQPYRFANEFAMLQNDACRNRRGLWSTGETSSDEASGTHL